MILRRVIAHFRKQEWTAIFLDFLIVVAGVFMGLQVSNWNAARGDRGRAHGFLERIGADLDADLASYEERLKFWKDVAAYGVTALRYAGEDDAGDLTQWRVLLAFFQASQVSEFYTTSTTYDELTGAGEVGLIPGVDLRNALANYYATASNPAFTERPVYREHVRGLIPLEIQFYIWDRCYSTDSHGRQDLLDCASPVDEAQAAAIVDAIRGDAALIAEMRYWISVMHVGEKIGEGRIEGATALRAMIDAALGDGGGS